MYLVTKERALAQARALSGALALAERAGWHFDRNAPLMLRPPFSNYLHVAAAELLLVPSIDPSRGDLAIVDRGMREARCDALVVKASTAGKPMLYCAVGRWRREQNLWCHERRLWLDEHGHIWLVAEHVWAEDAGTSILLLGPRRMQVASVPPWLCAHGMAAGFDRADAFLAQIWGGPVMAVLPWISPAAADDMLFDDPLGSSPDFGFALMRPRAKGKRNTTADLARAKFQPSKPDDAAWGPDGLWPITCTTSRLVPAPGVAIEPDALEGVFEGYDARVKPHQKLLATVLTMRFDHGWQATDILSLVGTYALHHLALERRLTSLTVVHMPADELSARRPHAHCVVLARVHRASGWGELHRDLVAKDAQATFEAEWETFHDEWAPRFAPG